MPNYYYNGVELPDINQYWTDKETYPYAILQVYTTGAKQFILASSPFRYYYHYGLQEEVVGFEGAGTIQRITWYADGTFEVNDPQNTAESFQFPVGIATVMWSSHDIFNEDGSVYLPASEPVPVPDEPEPLYRDNSTITLGSGTLYLTEYDGETLPDVGTLCVEDNRLGYIKGGAALQYTAEYFDEKDDLGIVSKVIPTSETASLKCGLITWNGETLQKLVDRCKVTTADGKRIVKIGGHGNSNGKTYAICFHHEDKKDGDLWVVLVGRNTAGFTITFGTDAGSLIEPEFKALPSDEDGTLVVLIEGSPSR